MPDPCTLVTAAETAAAFGEALAPAGAKPTPANSGGQACTYGTGTTRLLIQVYPSTAFYAPDRAMVGARPVSGPWDKGSIDDRAAALDFVKGGRTVIINVISLDARPPAAKLIALASAAAGRL